ncbi:hypothetical protein D9M71_218100 [compost metagenome]
MAVKILVGKVEIDGLVMGIGLAIQVQALDRDSVLPVLRILGVSGILLVLVVLQRQADFFVEVEFIAKPTLQVMGPGVHVAALGGVLGDAIAIAVELVVALYQICRNIPIQSVLAPGCTLESLVGNALGIEVVAAAHAKSAAQGEVLALVALGDDVDDAARSAGTIEAAGTGHYFDAFNAGRRDAIELAEVVPGSVLRHTIDQHKHVAPAQGLAEVAHAATGGCQARYQLPEDIGDPAAGAALLANLLVVDHLYRAGYRGNARFASSGRNNRGIHGQGTWVVDFLGPGLSI